MSFGRRLELFLFSGGLFLFFEDHGSLNAIATHETFAAGRDGREGVEFPVTFSLFVDDALKLGHGLFVRADADEFFFKDDL